MTESSGIEQPAESLMEQAFACLEHGDTQGALALALELKFLHHSSAFDIMGEAYAAQGEPGRAVAALEEGVRAAPGVWLLWQSLGNHYTRAGRFDEAQAAYGRALICPQVERSSVHFNRALLNARARAFDDALACLELVASDALRFKAASFKAAVLNDMRRYQEAEAHARRLLTEPPQLEAARADVDVAEDMARVHAHLGKACWLGRGDAREALEQARQALALTPGEPTATWLLGVIPAEAVPSEAVPSEPSPRKPSHLKRSRLKPSHLKRR